MSFDEASCIYINRYNNLRIKDMTLFSILKKNQFVLTNIFYIYVLCFKDKIETNRYFFDFYK